MNIEAVFVSINWWAVATAAVAGFVIGGAWYAPPLFGRRWMIETGLTAQALQARSPAAIFGPALVLSLVSAFVLAMFLGPDSTLAGGIAAGLAVGFGWVATSLGVIYLFERRTLALFLINSAYQVVNFAVMGAILGAWH